MSTKSDTRRLDLFCILTIVMITTVVYWDGMHTYFDGPGLEDLLLSERLRQGFYLFGSTLVRGVKFALLDLLKASFGLDPLPYHIVSISIHIINSIIVFFIAKRLTDNRLISLITALLFSTFWAHPETIIRIEHVHEELLAFFTLLTLVSFYTYRKNPTKLNYFLVLSFAVLALGCKESTPFFLLPLVYLTDRYVELERPGLPRTRFSKTPYPPLLLLSLGLLCYLRFSPVHETHIQGLTHYDKAFWNFLRWITFTFSFPVFSEEPRWHNVTLALLVPFYFLSPGDIKRRLVLLMVAEAVLAIPTAPLGSPALRYLYLSSFFSMTIFALMLYHGTTRVVAMVRVREAYSRILVIILCSLLIYYNYHYTNRLIAYYNKVATMSESLFDTLAPVFPDGTLTTHLVFINFPITLRTQPECNIWNDIRIHLWAYYGRDKVGQVSEFNLLDIYDGRYQLRDDVFIRNISIQEFEELTKGKDNTVYFFNSKDDSIHNVTGKDYTFLRRLVSGT